jgi:hypothetical protein
MDKRSIDPAVPLPPGLEYVSRECSGHDAPPILTMMARVWPVATSIQLINLGNLTSNPA